MPNQAIDWTPYLFLAAMIVAGGFVAWIADGLGRKIGKKRLSFMGLRPRYTATLLTVGAGVLIPILTIGAIYISSSEVRDWIREGRGAIKRAKVNQEKADELEKKTHQQEDTLKGLHTQIGNSKRQNEDLKNQKIKLTGQVADAKRLKAEAEQKTRQAQSQSAGLQKLVTSADKKIESIKAEIVNVKQQRTRVKQELTVIKGTSDKVQSDLRDAYQRGIELDKQNGDLDKKLALLQKDLDALQTQKREYLVQIDTFEDSVKTYQDMIRSFNDQITELSSQAKLLQTNVVSTRTRPMIFEAKEELARIQLPPSLSPIAAKNAYFDLLQRMRTVALEHKAINSAASPPAGLMAQEGKGRLVTIAEQEDVIIRGITSQRNELVFTARASFNTFEGEYVLVEFVAFRNKLVYPQGKLIAEQRIDGRGSEYEVITAIQEFLGTNLRAKAIRDGMIPPSGPNGQLGKLDTEEILNLAAEIRSNNQPVRLQAMAKSDTNAGDQLEITFRIRL